jgi:hypothetical protein
MAELRYDDIAGAELPPLQPSDQPPDARAVSGLGDHNPIHRQRLRTRRVDDVFGARHARHADPAGSSRLVPQRAIRALARASRSITHVGDGSV